MASYRASQTLLVAVVAVAGIFVPPGIERMMVRSRESQLRNNLFTLRTLIDNYWYDKGQAPQSLQTLVDDGYLHAMLADPCNNYSTAWRTGMDDSEPGIWDVHSASDKTTTEGTPYSEW